VAVQTTTFMPGMSRCDLVLPHATSFERTGTVVNALGRLQRLSKSLSPQFTARDVHEVSWGIRQGHDRAKIPETVRTQAFQKVAQIFSLTQQKISDVPLLGLNLQGLR
jgi:NADH dehydrogenase/NADH:ubiquinone oxidoreductase subunit G